MTTERPGLRERNKAEKLRRIKQAARELFILRGYDDATTREIAERADVGMGTLFLYADNKRDLLFLIANDDLDMIIANAIEGFRPDRSVLANLIAAFQPIYAYFGAQPKLSRMTLREMTFYDQGQQAKRFEASRQQLIGLLTRIMQSGQDRGQIVTGEQPDFIGWVAFSIYQVELRRWLLSDEPDLKAGIKRLERALRLFLSGAGGKGAPGDESRAAKRR